MSKPELEIRRCKFVLNRAATGFVVAHLSTQSAIVSGRQNAPIYDLCVSIRRGDDDRVQDIFRLLIVDSILLLSTAMGFDFGRFQVVYATQKLSGMWKRKLIKKVCLSALILFTYDSNGRRAKVNEFDVLHVLPGVCELCVHWRMMRPNMYIYILAPVHIHCEYVLHSSALNH